MLREVAEYLMKKDCLSDILAIGAILIVVLYIVTCITAFQVLELLWRCA